MEIILISFGVAATCFVLAGLISLALKALKPPPAKRPIAPKAADIRRIEADPKGKGAPINLDDGPRVGSFDILIEYVDAEGEASRRAITVVGFTAKRHEPGFMAYCYLRQAMRQFRFDRMTAVIDDDGEVHGDVPRFFRELGIGQSAREHFRKDVFGIGRRRREPQLRADD